MKDFQTIDHMQTAVAVIDAGMTIIEANQAYKNRSELKPANVIGKPCYQAAYKLNEICNCKTAGTCPVKECFKTGKPATAIHHIWIEDHAIVEEVLATPIVEKTGEIFFVVEEFRDVTKLLGLNKGIMGICSYCRKVRDEKGNWLLFEEYLEKHTGAKSSHGVCDECSKKLLTDFDNENTPS